MQECGECTLCCKLLDISWMDSPIGEWCKECDPTRGCKIWSNRPGMCRLYNCAWKQMDGVSPDFRPDKCKIIFDKTTDTIMTGAVHPDYKFKKTADMQISQFIKSGFSVVLMGTGFPKPQIYVAEGHTAKQVWEDVKKKTAELLNDSP